MAKSLPRSLIGRLAQVKFVRFAIIAARQMGVPTVEINPSETVLSPYVDYRLAMGAAQAMHEIWTRFPPRSFQPKRKGLKPWQ